MGSGKTHNGLRITIGVLGSAAILGGAGGAIYYLTTKQANTQKYTVQFNSDMAMEEDKPIFIPDPESDLTFELNKSISFKWIKNPDVNGTYTISEYGSWVQIGLEWFHLINYIDADQSGESGEINIPATRVKSKDVTIHWEVASETFEPEPADQFSQDAFEDFHNVYFVENKDMNIPYSFKEEYKYEIDPTNSFLEVNGATNERKTFQEWHDTVSEEFTWNDGKVHVPASIVTSSNIKATLAARKQDGRVDLKYNTEYFKRAWYSPMPFQYGDDDITVQFQLNPSHDIQLDDEASTIKVGKKNALPLKDIATDIKPEQSFRILANKVDAALVEVNLVPKVKEYELLINGDHFESAEKEIKYVKGQPVSFTIAAKGDWAKWFKFNVANSHVTKTVGGDTRDIQFEASWVVGDAVTIPAEVTNQADALSVYLGDEAIPYPIVVGSTGDQHLTVEAGQKFTYGSKLQVKYTITGEHYIVDEEKSYIVINDEKLNAAKVGTFEGNTYTLGMSWEDITKTAITVYFYSKEEDVGVEDCVKVTAKADTLLQFVASPAMSTKPKLQYCLDIDKQEWVDLTDSKNIPARSSIYLRGDNPSGWSTSDTVYATLKFTGDISLDGNIMGLLDNARGEITTMPNNYCFAHLFEGSTGITSIENTGKFISAQNLTQHCYDSMFKGCTSLTQAPALPVADQLAVGCYASMFEGCTGLTVAPELQATTLAANCYYHMFAGCEKLESAQAMTKVEVLAEGCCEGMYAGSGLTFAPTLAAPAIELAKDCYKEMFKDCKGIKVSEALLGTAPEEYCFCPDYDIEKADLSMNTYAFDMFTGTSGTFAGTPSYSYDLTSDHFYYNQIDQETRALDTYYNVSDLPDLSINAAFGTEDTEIPYNLTDTYTLTIDWGQIMEYQEEYATEISDSSHGWCVASTTTYDTGWYYNTIKYNSVSIAIKEDGVERQETRFEISDSYYGIVPTDTWGLTNKSIITIRFQLSEINTYESAGYFCIFAAGI
ncbi:MAG: hypothetical protein ACOQNY_01415 [Mycoplasmoidaceae bacterium]